MDKRKRTTTLLEAGALMLSFLGVTLMLRGMGLLSSPLTGQQFIYILFIPALIGVFEAILGVFTKNNEVVEHIKSLTDGILIGISFGYGFSSLVILYNWQKNPDLGHLEPLFVFLGIAAAGAETARRLTMKVKHG